MLFDFAKILIRNKFLIVLKYNNVKLFTISKVVKSLLILITVQELKL